MLYVNNVDAVCMRAGCGSEFRWHSLQTRSGQRAWEAGRHSKPNRRGALPEPRTSRTAAKHLVRDGSSTMITSTLRLLILHFQTEGYVSCHRTLEQRSPLSFGLSSQLTTRAPLADRGRTLRWDRHRAALLTRAGSLPLLPDFSCPCCCSCRSGRGLPDWRH